MSRNGIATRLGLNDDPDFAVGISRIPAQGVIEGVRVKDYAVSLIVVANVGVKIIIA